MKLVFTDLAREDLFAIGDHIAEDNPHRALSFVEEIEHRCNGIADYPLSCALLENHPQGGIRRAVHGRYGIFYRVGDETVTIMRVLSFSMHLETILFADD